MKFVAIALTGLIAIASAQGPNLSNLPKCAQDCANGSIPQNCGLDVKCICTSTSFLNAITCCVAEKCNKSEQDATVKFASGICGTAGVTSLPAPACSTGSASASASASSSASASASAVSNSSSATRTASGASSATNTASGSSAAAPASTSHAAAPANNANGGAIAAIAALLMALA